jgi:hypothetical protein
MLMTPQSTNKRNSCKHLVSFGALLAFGALGAYGCAAGEGVGESEGASADEAGGAELTDIVIGPAPTSTVTPIPGPGPVLIAHATMKLDPGVNHRSVTDDDLRNPYRVMATETLGIDDAYVQVSVPAAFNVTSPTACASFKLEFTLEGFSPISQTWVPLGEKSVSGVVKTSGGEFPTTFCDVEEQLAFGSVFSKVRVNAKGSRVFTLGGVPISTVQNTTVSVHGKNPIPNPGKLLHVTQVALNAAKTGAIGKVKNDGPQTATGVRATLSGSYLYCPPPSLPTESKYCNSGGDPCNGFFCPNGINPSGNPNATHRAARVCSLGSNQNSSTFSIAAGSTVTYSWPSSLDSDTSGCAPCNPNDGRCADISLTVRTNSIDENDPWDTWDQAQDSEFFNGVNE